MYNDFKFALRQLAKATGFTAVAILALALGTGQVVSGLLYQVSALDPVAFTVAPIVLAVASFFACWLPARRATRIDPIVALRTE